MVIKRNTFLYDITARFGPSGFCGAHAIDLEQVVDGSEVLAEKELPARAITETEFKSVLGGQAAALIEAADAARADRDARVAEALTEKILALDRAEAAERQQVRTQLALEEVTGKLSDALKRCSELEARMADREDQTAAMQSDQGIGDT